MTNKKPATKKIDLHESDKKIPRDLIIKYKDQHYILKAGLEWKANELFGGAGYSITIEPFLMDHKNNHYIIMAKLTVLENGSTFENMGEAKIGNVNPMMKNQMLHLAITRAECRVLRMATACGYASYDEVRTIDTNGETFEVENGDAPATEAQKKTLQALMGHDGEVNDKLTKQEASELINKYSTKK